VASAAAPIVPGPASAIVASPSTVARPAAPSAPSPSPRSHPTLAAARAALDRGDLEQAKGIYSQLLDVDSHDGEALLGMGDVARARKNTRVAASFYDAAVSASPRSLRALLALADAQWDLGEHDEARSNYRRITTAFPGENAPPRAAERLVAP
jgi:tetratricopeptide (TPR) repeat protein